VRARISREWLQKHPTPRAGDGAFHWYPAAISEEARAAIADELDGEATVWLAPGRVAVARRFEETAPGDGRRYRGIAAVIVEARDASVAALLGALPVPEPRPWGDDVAREELTLEEPAPMRPAWAHDPGLAAALWYGGRWPGPLDRLAGTGAALESWLPDEVRARPRRLTLAPTAPAPDAAARWLADAAAARGPALARARRALAIVAALAAAERRDLAAALADVVELAESWRSAAGLRRYLASAGVTLAPAHQVDGDGDLQWARAVHLWGRGRLDARDALAAILARRAVADALAARAGRWRRALRWEALLPSARADELEAAALARLPLLAELADA
jgi:hypothetical protein